MTRFCTQLNRSVTILHPRKSLKYQHIFEYRPVSFYAVDYCTDALCIKDGVKIDPTSGSGSLLINIGKSVARYMGSGNHIKYYAQELKENTYNLTRMNLVMRGILPDNIVTRNGDTLEDDWPYFDDNDPAGTYDPLYVDAVVSNPPYSQAWNPADKESDPRYARYGVAPKGKADYAFLRCDLSRAFSAFGYECY